jgi:hypothetical protein
VKTIFVWTMVLVATVSADLQAIPMFGLYPVLPLELTVAARDLAQIADEVVSKQNRCVSENKYGWFADAGGCNRFGCWPAGGSCNVNGCSLSGACTDKGCDSKIESFRCERPSKRGEGV